MEAVGLEGSNLELITLNLTRFHENLDQAESWMSSMTTEIYLRGMRMIFTVIIKKSQVVKKINSQQTQMDRMTLSSIERDFNQECQDLIATLKVKVRMYIHLSISRIASMIVRCILKMKSISRKKERLSSIRKN